MHACIHACMCCCLYYNNVNINFSGGGDVSNCAIGCVLSVKLLIGRQVSIRFEKAKAKKV